MTIKDGVFTCSPDWWRGNGARLMAEQPVRLVRFTSYPDDRVYDDAESETDAATGRLRFGPWPGVDFEFPPDYYDPAVWDYDRDEPVTAAGRGTPR
jgi:hypothetical protein